MIYLRALLGLAFFCGVAWLLSSDRKRFPWRVVLLGIAAQVVLGFLILKTSVGQAVFQGAADFVYELVGRASPGAEMVFGKLANFEAMAEVFGPDGGFIFAFAGRGLVVIIFFSALMSVLYHIGFMQALIWAMAKVMSLVLGVSGAEAMAMAANVFVGQTEAPLVVKPYLADMTRSELNALMTGGFATIAGSVLVVYVSLLGEEYGPHLLTASVMSAPAAFLIAKIMQPETGTPVTAGRVEFKVERTAHNAIEAAANGTSDGLKLWLNVIAMLVAFVGLVGLINWPLEKIGMIYGDENSLSLGVIFGWVFSPVAWVMGIESWQDCQLFGGLLGTKVAVNEFVAFTDMINMTTSEAGPGAFVSERSGKMAAYALCGFANFASVGIQIGGIAPLAPSRKSEIASLALRAMLGGAMASWMTATVAGMFL